MRGADPEIVAIWIKGWTTARETAPPVPDHGGFRVDVGWPQQKARYVFAALSPAIGELARAINEPWIFLKACAPPDAMQAMLPSQWIIQRRSEEHTSELQSLMRISYAVFCLKKNTYINLQVTDTIHKSLNVSKI